MNRLRVALLALLPVLVVACNRPPAEDSLRDSFAQQLSANKFVSEFQRSGDNMTFMAPAPDGTPSRWRVHIESASIEKQNDAKQPYKGTVAASWYVNGEQIRPAGRDSNLPIELTSNGLGQECWAFWDPGRNAWGWE